MHYNAFMSALLIQVGSRLRARRQEWNFTQADLAKRAGVSPRFLVQLEKGEGNISVGRLADVCGALSLPLADLFRGIGPGRPDKIALVGLRGAGKSSVGVRLAEATNARFIELDALVEQEAGMTLSEIFELRGESHYRTLEREVLERVLRDPEDAVIAAGGSIVTAPETWRRLQEGAQTVWLQASPGSHFERVRAQGDLRPMQGRPNAKAELEAILDERAGLYAQADVHLDTDGLGIDGVVNALAHDGSLAIT
jgi:XRE family aerobic/anaerobic benzoate catabolism transcriptional regulator